MREINKGDMCEYPGCSKSAHNLAFNRDTQNVLKTCDYHATVLDHQPRSEYTECCPNCGCQIPVN